MSWQRYGRVFIPKPINGQGGSHAQVPTTLVYEKCIRVFYADRNKDGKSYTTYVDLDRSDLTTVIYRHTRPILPFGDVGAFDDDGVMPSFALRQDGVVWLYYSGWNRGVTVPYRNSVGIAVSYDDGTTFERLFKGPVLDRTPYEPHIAVTPTIVRIDNIWRMWYISGLRWKLVNGRREPIYVIKNAHSEDGVNWMRPNKICIPQTSNDEAFSRPSVVKDRDLYRMWFCARSSVDYCDGVGSYRIGYAESKDGDNWVRMDDKHGLPVSDDPWEMKMTCYPFVQKIDGKIVMYYNGNGFGATGFGCAILSE